MKRKTIVMITGWNAKMTGKIGSQPCLNMPGKSINLWLTKATLKGGIKRNQRDFFNITCFKKWATIPATTLVPPWTPQLAIRTVRN